MTDQCPILKRLCYQKCRTFISRHFICGTLFTQSYKEDSTAVKFTAFCPQYNSSLAEKAPLYWSDPNEVSAHYKFRTCINAALSGAMRCHDSVNINRYVSLHLSARSLATLQPLPGDQGLSGFLICLTSGNV